MKTILAIFIIVLLSTSAIAQGEYFLDDESNGIGINFDIENNNGSKRYSGTFSCTIKGKFDIGFGFGRTGNYNHYFLGNHYYKKYSTYLTYHVEKQTPEDKWNLSFSFLCETEKISLLNQKSYNKISASSTFYINILKIEKLHIQPFVNLGLIDIFDDYNRGSLEHNFGFSIFIPKEKFIYSIRSTASGFQRNYRFSIDAGMIIKM